jgi:AGZA family xanthine/uracil permease-like MFS transporter
VFLVMLPAKLTAQTQGASPADASRLAFQVGLAACFLCGAIELVAAPLVDWVRRNTPRAALLSTLSGIAISFIAIDFAVRTFAMPLIALLPLGVILTTYFAQVALPLRMPGGAWALLLGTAAAWLATLVPGARTPADAGALAPALTSIGFYFPVPVLSDLYTGLTRGQALRLPGVEHIASQDRQRRSRQHTLEQHLRRKPKHALTQPDDQQELDQVVDGEPKEAIEIPGYEPGLRSLV